jgi:uncharacterized protein YdeI (YjbR/CyaY-like superfamily)
LNSTTAPTFFDSAEHFRAWLEANHATAAELIVGFRKVGSGLPSMTWSQSVDEALCFGWIDGVTKRIDEMSYQIRFTPRRAGSIWSLVNVAKVEKLTALGRMRPAGIAAFEARSSAKTGVYSFEQTQPIALGDAELRVFRQNKAAWNYFESTAGELPQGDDLLGHLRQAAGDSGASPRTADRRLRRGAAPAQVAADETGVELSLRLSTRFSCCSPCRWNHAMPQSA